MTLPKNLTSIIMYNIPFYILFGIICGFASLYFTRTTLFMEDKIYKIINSFGRWSICSMGLGMLIFFFPPLYGEGYGCLTALLNGRDLFAIGTTYFSGFFIKPWIIPLFFLGVFFFKVFSMFMDESALFLRGLFFITLLHLLSDKV